MKTIAIVNVNALYLSYESYEVLSLEQGSILHDKNKVTHNG